LLLSLCSAALHAQVTSGTIFGTIKDSSGGVIADAKVTVSSAAIGLTRSINTSPDGNFVFPNLQPGTYTISVEAPGFKKAETTGLVLSATDKLNAGDFVLQVGAAGATVTVSADAAQLELQSNSGERSDLITSKQLRRRSQRSNGSRLHEASPRRSEPI
jgi:hypothetical protein